MCVWVWIHECRYPQRPEASHSSGVWVPSSCRKLMWVLELNWGPLREQHATHLTTGQLCRPKWSLFWGLAHSIGFPFLSFASLRLQLGCQRKGTEVEVAIWKGACHPAPASYRTGTRSLPIQEKLQNISQRLELQDEPKGVFISWIILWSCLLGFLLTLGYWRGASLPLPPPPPRFLIKKDKRKK